MITLSQIDKTYNKKKPSEVHVLNHISLTFEKPGLVVLLGPSGSGKTTLLNVIGGLDKADHGTIQYDQRLLKTSRTKAMDEVRNYKIGTIFQNYYLLPQETVYENIALTLKMIGITDAKLLDDQIARLLKAVKMEHYQNRKAAQLSGGQQQRVAIARALAKDPEIVIADEPTGNLDSRNTVSIMQMIRSIAHHKLVIMVTHEEHLAYQFGDRIIQMSDGKIIADDKNTPVSSFNLSLEDEIYLKDLKTHPAYKDPQSRYQLYFDESLKTPLDLSVVVKNHTIYIKLPAHASQKVVLVDEDTDLKFIDAHAKDARQNVEKNTEAIDATAFNEAVPKKRRRHVISLKESIRMAVLKLKSVTKAGRLLYVGFALSGAVVALATAFLGSIFIVRPADALIQPSETVFIERQEVANYQSFQAMTALPAINGVSLAGRVNTTLELIPIYQSQGFINFSTAWFDIALFEGTLVEGRMPSAPDEIIIDRIVAEALMQETQLIALEIDRLDIFLRMQIRHPQRGLLKIVGISDQSVNGIYADPLVAMQHFIARSGINPVFVPARAYAETIEIFEGRFPEGEFETMISALEYSRLGFPSLEDTDITIDNTTYDVVGVYFSALFENRLLLSDQGFERVLFHQLDPTHRIYLYNDDAARLIEILADQNLMGISAIEHQIREVRAQNLLSFSGLLIFTLVALVASGLSFYFIIRSSMIARIYDIGVYRSLGVSKWDIQKLFIIETVILTSITSLIGFVGMSYLLQEVQNAAITLTDILQITPLTVLGGIGFIYLINVISGFIPITLLLQKTPAMINAQYDI